MLTILSSVRWHGPRTSWILGVLAAMACVGGCYSGPTAAHFVSVADELEAPSSWQLVQSTVRDPDGSGRCVPSESPDCPGAIRSYVATGDPNQLYAQAMDVAQASGFTVVQELYRGCTGGSPGPICSFVANRGSDALFVSVFMTPGDAELPAGAPGMGAVVMTAQRAK